MALTIGTKAPDFTLMNQDRQPVTLSALRGRPVVLAFFPAAFSSVCTKELCTIRDGLGKLNAADAQVFGISVDTFFALKAFHDSEHFAFPLLSDFNKTVIREYDVFNEDMVGLKVIAKRAVFVLRQGRRRCATGRCSTMPGTSPTMPRCSPRSNRSPSVVHLASFSPKRRSSSHQAPPAPAPPRGGVYEGRGPSACEAVSTARPSTREGRRGP